MTEWKRRKDGYAEKEKKDPFFIEEKFKDYIYYIDPMLDKFPKSERFGLYKTIKELNYGLLSDIIISAKTPATARTEVLKGVDRRLQALKFFIRYAYDSPKKCICAMRILTKARRTSCLRRTRLRRATRFSPRTGLSQFSRMARA